MSGRILVVEVDWPELAPLVTALERLHHEVVVVAGGDDLAARVRGWDADLVLTADPARATGLEPRADAAHVPVVGLKRQGDAAVAGAAGAADEMVVLPIDDLVLATRMRAIIRCKQAVEQTRLRRETARTVAGAVAPPPPPVGADGGRICLMARREEAVAGIAGLLADDGHAVQILNPASATAGRVAQMQPDAVIVAFEGANEPVDGVIASLRGAEATRQVPGLLVVDGDDLAVLHRYLNMGLNDILTHPVDADECRARVRLQIRYKRLQDELHASMLRSLSDALTDRLTGLHNRRYLSSHLDSAVRRMRDSGKPLSLLMMDIDQLPRVVSAFGDEAGDRILVEVAHQIVRNVRRFDLAARYGGEEFVVVMPDTQINGALMVADRLRDRITRHAFSVHGSTRPVPVTVSIGVVENGPATLAADGLLKLAGEALETARAAGRNRIVPQPRTRTPDREAG
ncbi:MAG: diguanylate cyclase [Hyphomicrobiales bacterium]|nr:diguanylate cyclase [Hyphomicrobiales bacterium]MCP5370776.1 diguanylate cyclase [Hyphomicrobiales bacterium]